MGGKKPGGAAYNLLMKWASPAMRERKTFSNKMGKDEYVVTLHPDSEAKYDEMVRRQKIVKRFGEISVAASTYDTGKGFLKGVLSLLRKGPSKTAEGLKYAMFGASKATEMEKDIIRYHSYLLLKDLHAAKCGEDKTKGLYPQATKFVAKGNAQNGSTSSSDSDSDSGNGNGSGIGGWPDLLK
ncbi:uncharacterized protein LOC132273525 [Cornus florida]|uniref:uncharacterized protein LOC132273525 n=1 Tax=Cornus florida TaxID=4283 RepID=UPI00289EEE10|nr:uncharacterized protein LOC132273525 [Cornus florida]